MREKYDRQFHVQINKNGFWRQLTSKASQASASESRVLAKKTSEKSPATDSRTQTSFQNFHTVFLVILDSRKQIKIIKISTSLHSDVTLSRTNQHRSSNSKSPIKTHFSLTLLWPPVSQFDLSFLSFFFFFLEHHTHTHSYRLSAIFSLRINFTALSSLSLLKRSIKRRIRVLSAIDSLPTPTTILLFSVSPFIQLLQLLFSTNIVCLFVWLMRFACWFWWKVC